MYGGAGDYQKTANADIICLPMLETKTAVDNMEAILDVEGIDGVYVGPSDLGFSYGLVPKLDREEPEILKIYDKLIKECDKRGLNPGIHCSGPAGAAKKHRHGLQAGDAAQRQRHSRHRREELGQRHPQGLGRQGVTPQASSSASRPCGRGWIAAKRRDG